MESNNRDVSEQKDNVDSEDEFERTQIRKELSTMSFEELQKLKEQMGAKLYKEAIFGTSSKKNVKAQSKVFKRENKNSPLEMSSKKPVSMRETQPTRTKEFRDPRFDPMCGDFDKTTFKKTYKFLDKVKSNDLNALKKELTFTEDPEKIDSIKYLIQRMENQNREEKRHKQKNSMKRIEKAQQMKMLKDGQKPEYLKKSEKRVKDLVDKYENYKKSGKLKKHIEKKRKLFSQKEKKKHLNPTLVK